MTRLTVVYVLENWKPHTSFFRRRLVILSDGSLQLQRRLIIGWCPLRPSDDPARLPLFTQKRRER